MTPATFADLITDDALSCTRRHPEFRAAVETAVSGMFAVVGARSPYATSSAAAPEPQPHSPAGPSEQQTPQEPPDSARSDSARSDSALSDSEQSADEADEGQDRRAG